MRGKKRARVPRPWASPGRGQLLEGLACGDVAHPEVTQAVFRRVLGEKVWVSHLAFPERTSQKRVGSTKEDYRLEKSTRMKHYDHGATWFKDSSQVWEDTCPLSNNQNCAP